MTAKKTLEAGNDHVKFVKGESQASKGCGIQKQGNQTAQMKAKGSESCLGGDKSRRV